MTDPSLDPRAGAPQTGDAAVDAALIELTAAAGAPIGDQVEAYVGAHRTLQDRLADIDG